ncbi:hypothetical protein A3H53_03405 [Candidatus Nomurabacteria bacterium RIFCSPLOWO2_02_FULL_40_10]|uniref:Uncharacterized protein n=2 Tax=Candidatus Nomuraibacteriota TaxID=1752729 RepID=A0A1F6XVL3_9BACT|nr:MAG: hypothetical protein A2642_01940 [Candidatus Nomurabacteria bacterium RIFCSPHIGHO2_01_FULL_39_10]OGI98171.1 MAG: hypothetical protein A3H53_03405 [Candidatus Nomurabacteria bacterium RIFCSPLOWO2_02_FULL_40_10]
MELNEKQNKEKIISWISFILVIFVLGGMFWYVYQEQNNTIAGFQENAQRLQQENEAVNKTLDEMTKNLDKTNTGFQNNVEQLQQENEMVNKTLGTANKTLNELKKTLAKTNDELAVVKFVCSGFTECKQQMGKMLQERLLKRNGIDTFTEEGGGTGLNFYKYFLVPQKWDGSADPVSNEMLAFIKAECPAKIYNQQGFLVSKSRYRISKTKIAEIIMDNSDDGSSEILCAWTVDETTKQFQKID